MSARMVLLALLCTGTVSGVARADVQGVRLPGSRGQAQTTAGVQAGALGRMPRREQPREHAANRRPHAAAGRRRTANGAATLSRSTATAASLGSSFPGPTLSDSGAYPPDTMGDVGPTQFIVMINGRVRSYDKATGLPDGVLDTSTDTFFSTVMTPLGGSVTSNFTSDPHIRYDRLSQRWIAVMIDVPNGAKASNRIMVAVSSDPIITPSTTWHFFQFGEGTSGEFADYPTLGIDANALYIGTNQFTTAAHSDFAGCNVYVVQKSSILGAGPIHATAFSHVTTASGSGPYTPQGVDNADPAATQGWLIGVDNLVFGRLDLLKVLSPASATPTLSSFVGVTVPATAFPISVPHLNGSPALDALDDRLFAAQIRNGQLWTAHNIGVTSTGAASTSGANRTASRWYDIDLTGAAPALSQSGTVFDATGTSPSSYWIPSVAVNGEGYMVIGGSVSGAASNPDGWFASRAPGDPAGAVTVPTRYTSANASYNPPYDRWGDYSLTRVDPQDDQTLWTIQEDVADPNRWGVSIARIQAPAPAVPAVSGSDLVAPGQAHASVTLTGDSSAGPWFDPGSSFPDRLGVTVGCGITVNSISVTGPAGIQLDLDTTSAGNGSCDVKVTNPDGQSATATGLLTTVPRPVAADDSGYTVPQDGTIDATTSVLANDSDPRGEPLTAQQATAPAHGALTLRADGTFTYVPAAGYSGTDSFTYRAVDSETSSHPATVTVTVQARSPTTTTATTTTDQAPAPVLSPVTPAAPAAPPAAPVRCVVPRLKGKTVAQARRLLTKAHCRAGKITRVSTKKVRRHRVLSTRPSAATRHAKGTVVKLTVRR